MLPLVGSDADQRRPVPRTEESVHSVPVCIQRDMALPSKGPRYVHFREGWREDLSAEFEQCVDAGSFGDGVRHAFQLDELRNALVEEQLGIDTGYAWHNQPVSVDQGIHAAQRIKLPLPIGHSIYRPH